MKPKTVRISCRPYAGTIFATSDKAAFERLYRRTFGRAHILEEGVEGRASAGIGVKRRWTALVYAKTPWDMAHELSHAVMFLFERCGIEPSSGGGEAFCYMLSQLMYDTRGLYKNIPSKWK